MLKAFFLLYTNNSNIRSLLYAEMLAKYVQDPKDYIQRLRKKGSSLARIVKLVYIKGELFYLVKMLQLTRGPRSFKHLRTQNSIVYKSFEDVARASSKVLGTDYLYIAFNEATRISTGRVIRSTFIMYIINQELDRREQLEFQDRYRAQIIDNLSRVLLINGISEEEYATLTEADIEGFSLQKIYTELRRSSIGDIQIYIPTPDPKQERRFGINSRIRREIEYYSPERVRKANNTRSAINIRQAAAFDEVVQSIESYRGRLPLLFFLNGLGGTGKTFIYTAIAAYFYSRGKIVIYVASTGITILLLLGGTTIYSRFRIPIRSNKSTTYPMSLSLFEG